MRLLHSPAAVAALALCLAVAVPAHAQPATPQPAAAAPAATETDDNGENASAGHHQRRVSGRDLLTREERRNFRRQMEDASPDEQRVLWERKHAELEQRAAQRGVKLNEPDSGRSAKDDDDGQGRRNAAESGPAEQRAWVVILVTRQPLRAP